MKSINQIINETIIRLEKDEIYTKESKIYNAGAIDALKELKYEIYRNSLPASA